MNERRSDQVNTGKRMERVLRMALRTMTQEGGGMQRIVQNVQTYHVPMAQLCHSQTYHFPVAYLYRHSLMLLYCSNRQQRGSMFLSLTHISPSIILYKHPCLYEKCHSTNEPIVLRLLVCQVSATLTIRKCRQRVPPIWLPYEKVLCVVVFSLLFSGEVVGS